MAKEKSSKSKGGCALRGLAGGTVMVLVLLMTLILSLDSIASGIADGILLERGLVCEDGASASVSLLKRTVTMAPNTCKKEGSSLSKIAWSDTARIAFGNGGLESATAHTAELSLTLAGSGSSEDAPTPSNPAIAALGIQRVLKSLALNVSKLNERALPTTTIDRVSLSRKGMPKIELIDVKMAQDNGEMTVTVESARLSGKSKGLSKLSPFGGGDPISVSDMKVVAKGKKVTLSGKVSIRKGIGPASIKLPMKIKITGSGLDKKSPDWDFSVTPLAPTL